MTGIIIYILHILWLSASLRTNAHCFCVRVDFKAKSQEIIRACVEPLNVTYHLEIWIVFERKRSKDVRGLLIFEGEGKAAPLQA